MCPQVYKYDVNRMTYAFLASVPVTDTLRSVPLCVCSCSCLSLSLFQGFFAVCHEWLHAHGLISLPLCVYFVFGCVVALCCVCLSPASAR